jgi:hypothetical protein
MTSTISGSDLHRFINSGYLNNGDSYLNRGANHESKSTPKSPHFHRPPNFSYNKTPNYITPYRSSANRGKITIKTLYYKNFNHTYKN